MEVAWRTSPQRKVRDAAASLVRRVAAQPRDLARRIVTRDWLEAVSDVAEREPIEIALVVRPSLLSLREKALRRALARNPRLPSVVELRGDGPATRLQDCSTLVYVGRGAPLHEDMATWLEGARIVLIDGSVREGLPRLLDRLTERKFELDAHEGHRPGGFFVLRHDLARQTWAGVQTTVASR
jgi:hypothetical protein